MICLAVSPLAFIGNTQFADTTINVDGKPAGVLTSGVLRKITWVRQDLSMLKCNDQYAIREFFLGCQFLTLYKLQY